MRSVVSHVSFASLLVSALPAQNVGLSLTNRVDGLYEIPYSQQVVPQSGMTFEAWLTYDDSTIPAAWTWPTVARQNQNASSEAWFLRVEAANTNRTSLRFKVKTSTGDINVDWPFSPGQLTAWTHVAATYDGATARLIVNGTEVANRAGNGLPPFDQGGTLRIGKGSDIGGPIEVWNGQLDEVRLWPFARTAAEIASTMGMELNGVPGLVSTWNFNNTFQDSSGGLTGTAQGTIPFVANTLTLTAPPTLFGFAYGTSTAGCFGSIEVGATALPTVGNADFAVVATRVPANALAIGFLGYGPSNPAFRVVGVDVFIDPNNADWFLLTSDGLGTVRLPLPIPATVASGLAFAVQFGIADPCGPQGWTASTALGTGTF